MSGENRPATNGLRSSALQAIAATGTTTNRPDTTRRAADDSPESAEGPAPPAPPRSRTHSRQSSSSGGKVSNNYKRFEMGLRQFRPRLELIRRSIPVMYEPYVRNLITYLREARAKAVEPLFSDTVVPKNKP